MATGIEQFVKIAPPTWPGEPLDVQPGDLSLFAPMGFGLGPPAVTMPWEGVGSGMARSAYYGFQEHTGHPFSGAPATEANGGTVYFGADCERADVDSMLRLMGIYGHLTDYAAFTQDGTRPEDRYITQLRFVSGGALEYVYGAADEPAGRSFRQQTLSIGEAIWRFIDWFRTENEGGRYSVEGTLGGDGDWARESLAFGLMVENEYHSIYRVWTRAWLVT